MWQYCHRFLYYTVMITKGICTLVSTSILLSMTTAHATMTLSDLSSTEHREAIQGLLDRNVVQGYADGTFRPNATINRAEFLHILMKSRFPNRTPSDVRCFLDLETKVPQWYANSVCTARELGIVSGYPDGTFRPERTVNFAEALKMAFLSFGMVPENLSSTPWYEPYLLEARSRGILPALLRTPDALLTRGAMAELTYVLTLNAEHDAEHETDGEAVCGNDRKESGEQCDDGNTEDSDGCSSICILVPEPVRQAFLQIDAETTGTLATIAQGQRNVTLLKFSAKAARQDAILTSLTFAPTVGSLLYADSYTLLMDRTGTGKYDTVVQSNGKTDGGRLVFDALGGHGILIPKDLTVRFALKANLVSTLGPVTLGVNFATDTAAFVEAQGSIDGIALTDIETNGTCTDANCFIRVNTRATADINVVERGSLFVTQDAIPTPGHILLGGTVSTPLLRLRLHATGEDIDLRELRIDGITNSVHSVLLYTVAAGQSIIPHSATPFAQASNGQCENQSATRVCAILGLRTLVIPANQDVIVIVASAMKADTLGGRSGEQVTLSLAAATDRAGGAVFARGIGSNQELSQNNGDSAALGEVLIGTATPAANREILGRTNDTALATIATVSNAGPANETFIPTGNVAIGSFRIDAAPHGNTMNGLNDVVLNTITFRVHAQNVQIDPAGYRLVSADDQNAALSCSAAGTTGTISVTCANIENGAIRSRIPQGQFGTYRLMANVTNPAIAEGTSSLSVDLPILGNRSETNAIVWNDEVTTFTWVDVPVTSVSSTMWRR